MKAKEDKNSVADHNNEQEISPDQDIENTAGFTESLPGAAEQEAGELAQLELQVSEARDKYLRLYSDFDNYKKRINRERADLIRSAGQDVLASLLPMLDDMERAIKSMNDAKDIAAVKEGIHLVYHKMKTITEAKGLKAMETVGKDFDADLHDAIANVPAPSENQKGKIVEEIEKGYYLNDKVLRHAKVIVGN